MGPATHRPHPEWQTTLVMKDGLAKRDPQSAVALLEPVVAANPLHEPAHRAAMGALAAAGRRAEALMLFERLRAVLQQELAAEPELQTRQLYRDLLASSRRAVRPNRRAGRAPRTCRRA